MPRRPRSDLTAGRRQAMAAELKLFGIFEERAAMDKYVHISMAIEAGMTLREVAEVYGVSQGTVMTWKAKGERERERRRSGDPV